MKDATEADVPLLQLLEERQLGAVLQRAFDEPRSLLDLLKDAGGAGVVAYMVVFAAFYSVAVPVGMVAYYSYSGEWFDPLVLLQDDGSAAKVEALAVLASFYLLCKPFAPVRLGGALLLTPDVKQFIQARPALVAAFAALGEGWDATAGRAGRALGEAASRFYPSFLQRAALKAELSDLAATSRGGVVPLQPDEQRRLEAIVTSELPSLNPTPEPARSALFSGEWECLWTTEKELNFAVERGLFGLPWQRTYQTINVADGTLTNVIQFDGGALTVASAVAPDAEGDGSRFAFSFNACSVQWRGLEVPLPPVGRGWGELLYIDEQMRIQRDIRGDLLVATRVE